ncbi:MAG: fatty acid desaturase [Alphaproteobacteria bacterium]|nr:MAG: fatty acid desaturase [Alphaproteobacteria bacterium]
MTNHTDSPPVMARDWLKLLAEYRRPSHLRSFGELVWTGLPFVGLWVAAWAAYQVSFWLSLVFAVPAGLFLVRLFLIQHDCGHYAFFRSRALNDWVGRAIGVLSLTPYDVWRQAHAMHHATSGNLDRRGVGDVDTLTVEEYEALPKLRRLLYRLYRHPIVLFGVGPTYNFVIRNRLPAGLRKGGWRYWVSAMGTNVAVIGMFAVLIVLVGPGPFLAVHLPVLLCATTVGVWLFYVQHQFEETFWEEGQTWSLQEAALRGSSYYVLPPVLRWFTANISVHHVHHLSSRIPFYRLPQVLKDFPELKGVSALTLWESLKTPNLKLWDSERRRLISFSTLRDLRRERSQKTEPNLP